MALALYLDDCANARLLVSLLRTTGHTVTTPGMAGTVGARDPVHFQYAKQSGLILVTKNPSDFLELHSQDPEHPGLLLIYQDNDVNRDMSDQDIVAAISNLESALAPEDLAKHFHVLNQWR